MQMSAHAALIEWAKSVGEASDYTDNYPSNVCPTGHWYGDSQSAAQWCVKRRLRVIHG